MPHCFCFAFSSRFSSVTLVVKKSGLAFLLVLASCLSSSAQDAENALSARLISEPVVSASRPRSVSAAVGIPESVASTPVAHSFNDATAIERRAFERTNDERAKAGLAPLTWDADLCRMARIHSENMARLNFFAHETPEGMRLKERARSLGVLGFRVIAENIAYNKGYADPGAFAVDRWMISAGHRANILYVGFQNSAIGSFVAKDGSVYLTQVFITR